MSAIDDAVMGGQSRTWMRGDPERMRQLGVLGADRQEGDFFPAIRSKRFQMAML